MTYSSHSVINWLEIQTVVVYLALFAEFYKLYVSMTRLAEERHLLKAVYTQGMASGLRLAYIHRFEDTNYGAKVQLRTDYPSPWC